MVSLYMLILVIRIKFIEGAFLVLKSLILVGEIMAYVQAFLMLKAIIVISLYMIVELPAT